MESRSSPESYAVRLFCTLIRLDREDFRAGPVRIREPKWMEEKKDTGEPK